MLLTATSSNVRQTTPSAGSLVDVKGAGDMLLKRGRLWYHCSLKRWILPLVSISGQNRHGDAPGAMTLGSW
jgi:hypothetical protein